MGSVVLRHLEFIPRARARLEQLQSIVQRGDVCQSLRGVAHHAGHVFGMEGTQAHQDRQITRDGS